MSRSSTVILCYLSLYKKVQCWRSIDHCDEYLLKYHHVSTPNQFIVEQIIRDNQEFQNQQHDPWNKPVVKKVRSPVKPNARLIQLQTEEANRIENDKRRRNEMDQQRKRWEQEKARFEGEESSKLQQLNRQYELDY